MAQSRTGQIFAVAVAGAIALAYVQVSSVPTPPAATSTPDIGVMISNAKADLAWFRAEIPRDSAWWRDVASTSSTNLAVLHTVLSGDGAHNPVP